MQLQPSFLTLDEWQSFVDSCDNSTAFHHRHWLGLISEHYGWKVHIPALVTNDEVTVAIPFVETRGLFGGTKWISLPFTDCTPPLEATTGSLNTLLGLLHDGPHIKTNAAVIIRSNHLWADRAYESPWYQHVLPLNETWPNLERKFSSSLRRNLRRAQSSELRFTRRTDEEAIRIFYKLHVLTRRRLGVPVQPKQFFVELHSKILANDLGHVAVVAHENRPIAAAVFLTYKKTVIYKYGASSTNDLHLRPNEFLFYNAIQQARENGNERFDFGVTAKDHEGLRRFKQKWGPDEHDVHDVYLMGEPGTSLLKTRVLAAAGHVIRRTPPVVCRGLGEFFYRFSQ